MMVVKQEGAKAGADNLRFRDFRFPTREYALETLNKAYATASRSTNVLNGAAAQEHSSDIVLLSGVSGTGKSTLVKQFIADLRMKASSNSTQTAKQEDGSTSATITKYPYVLTGKYDEAKGGSRPLSGIIEAFSGFALEFEDDGWAGAGNETNRLQEAIRDKLGEEACFLTTVIPELVTLVGKQKSQSSSTEEEQEQVQQHGNAWNRLRYIFQAFTAAISTEERPVILILDDLQWMDSASVELLQSLLCDQSLKHFVFVGGYRSNEVTAEHKLSVALDNIKKSADIKTVELANLNLTEMTNFLSETLRNHNVGKANDSTESKEIASLAKSIFDKTHGNICFALEILDDLQRKEVLQYSYSDSSWTWSQNPQQVIDLLSSTDLQGIIREKIMSASQILQQVLISMAYTRSSIDLRTLREIMQHNGWGLSAENLVTELKMGKALDLLTNKKDSPVYRFAHDNIQQAAYELVPSGEERTQFRVDMGMRLINLYENHKRDWLLFAGADHLNATADQKTAESKFLLKINVKAGERAQSVAAFDAASDFLGRAIKIVEAQPDAWHTSYESTLCLYRNLAAVEFCQGRTETGNRLAEIVLENAISADDRVSTMTAMAKALGVEQKHKESVDLGFRTLNMMKMYPKSSLRYNSLLLQDMMAVQRFWKGNTNEQILQLPTLRDQRTIAAIEILGNAVPNSVLLKDDMTLLRITFRSLRLTFQLGLCPQSVKPIIGFMIIRIQLRDFNGAKRLAELARAVSKRMNSNQITAFMVTGVSYFVSGWNEPTLKVLNDFEQGYKASMACGDHEFAAINGHGYCITQYLSGYQLSLVEHRFSRLITELKANNGHAARLVALQMSLSVHILQGKIPFHYESLMSSGCKQTVESDNTELAYIYVNRMMLGVYFGRSDLSEVMLANFNKLSGPKRNRSRAKPYIKRLESITKGLGTNSLHRLMIMKAHNSACKHTTLAEVKKGYDDAVHRSVKTGHIQDAGLACQMAAQYLSSTVGAATINDSTVSVRLNAAGEYLKKAVKWYKRWGADGLVGHLQRQLDSVSMSGSSKGTYKLAASKCSEESVDEKWMHLEEPTLFNY